MKSTRYTTFPQSYLAEKSYVIVTFESIIRCFFIASYGIYVCVCVSRRRHVSLYSTGCWCCCCMHNADICIQHWKTYKCIARTEQNIRTSFYTFLQVERKISQTVLYYMYRWTRNICTILSHSIIVFAYMLHCILLANRYSTEFMLFDFYCCEM